MLIANHQTFFTIRPEIHREKKRNEAFSSFFFQVRIIEIHYTIFIFSKKCRTARYKFFLFYAHRNELGRRKLPKDEEESRNIRTFKKIYDIFFRCEIIRFTEFNRFFFNSGENVCTINYSFLHNFYRKCLSLSLSLFFSPNT